MITAAIQRGEVIYHVEGERDAGNLVKLGLEATTSPQGAGNWKPAMAEYYTGAGTVVIIPDKDPAGRAYAADVASNVFPRAKHIKIIELPGEGNKDASDWIAAGGTSEERAVVRGGQIVAATMMSVTLSCDHRAAGRPAGRNRL